MLSKQDLSIIMLYYLGYSKFQNCVLRLRKEAVTAILTFHDIPFEQVKRFEAKMSFLKRMTNVISLDDYMAGEVSYEKINVVITFDDGYKGWINNAIPVLKQLGLPATFFVSSGSIGLSKERQNEFISKNLNITYGVDKVTGCLSEEKLKKIANDGFTIGGHTLTHRILSTVDDQETLLYEIEEDKKNLEDFTGLNVDYFSYPSGVHINPKVDLVSTLKKCGYKGAVTLISGFNKFDTNPYLLHREITGVQMLNHVFRGRVYGNNIMVKKIKGLLSSISGGN